MNHIASLALATLLTRPQLHRRNSGKAKRKRASGISGSAISFRHLQRTGIHGKRKPFPIDNTRRHNEQRRADEARERAVALGIEAKPLNQPDLT